MSNISKVRYADSTAMTPMDLGNHFTTDSLMTFDSTSQFTIDSTGTFLVGQLERLDQTAHPPLSAVTWPRDIDLREDVQLGDETSSFTLETFAITGGTTPSGINWISKEANSIPSVALDIGKIVNPLTEWGVEMKFTVLELASAARTGRPIDTRMYDAIQRKYQMDIDQMVYIGDPSLARYGMANSPLVTATNAVTGAASSTLWASKTPDEILKDVNALLTASWTATGYSKIPTDIRLPPVQFSYLAANKVSSAGNQSILEYVRNNSISNAGNGRPVNIQPVKWLVGRGASATDRAFAYTRDRDLVRYPLVPMQKTPVEYRSLFQIVTYYARLGVVEVVYPETMAYLDAI